MASYGYTRDFTEEELAPPEVHVYTKKELWENWWDYNLKWVIAGIAFAAIAIYLVLDAFVLSPKTDYQIAIVSPSIVSEDVRNEIKDTLTPLLDDVTGDDKVTVSVVAYMVDFSTYGTDVRDDGGPSAPEASAESETTNDAASFAGTNDYYMEMAGQVQLSADIEIGETTIFIVHDPENMQAVTNMFCATDGSMPNDGTSPDWTDTVYAVEDCSFFTDNMRAVLGDFFLVRRNSATDLAIQDKFEFYQPLWELLTEGATPYSEKVA